MAITMLLGFTKLALSSDLQAKLDQYTCSQDGFVHAHQDQFDPLFVYLESECPVDAVITEMVPVITSLVSQYYGETDAIANPFERVNTLIQSVRTAMAEWLQTHARDDIAQFLNVEATIRAKIINELISQGILA